MITTKATSDAVWDWDVNTNTVSWSEGILTLLGYHLENNETAPGWRLQRIHSDDRAAVEKRYYDVVRGKELFWVDEYRFQCADGSYKNVRDRGYILRDGDGRASRIIGSILDITEQKQAEEALRDSEQRWRSLTEALPQLVWSATCDGACDYFSTQWTEHTGVPERDLLGWRWLEVLHPDDRAPTRKFWTDSVAGRRPYDVEYRVRRSDGEYRWFKTRGVPIRDRAGTICKWFGTCTDISDLREAENALRDSESRFRGTFENAAVGIAHVDAAGRFLRVNEKFCAFLGYPRDELLQRTFQDMTHPDDLATSLDAFTALMRGESPGFHLEKRYMRKDGSFVWGELFTSLQRNAAGAPAYDIAIVHDISERKRLEEELRQAKESAEAANRAKDEFLANVSHEIRTPMNAILGLTELVLDTPLAEDQRQSLKTVKSAADNLLRIISDLLDFAKIEAGKLELDVGNFSLRSTVGDTLRALAARAHRKGLEVVCSIRPDVPDCLIGDAGRLRQVLLNLVGNAIKFTEQGEVVVTVAGMREEQKPASPIPHPSSLIPAEGEVDLRFTVRDTGIGVPVDKQTTIFRAFEQEDASTTRKYGGTGLGLTIAARLVALMGGQISVESAPGQGSTFAFSGRFGLQPQAAEPAAATEVMGRARMLLRSLPVLIVDDNATNRHILREWLRGWQTEPAVADDGVAAMDALWEAASRGRPYQLVLLDTRMPHTDGLALAAQIRKRAALAATRIILLSSGDRPGDWERLRELRIDAHLLKPIQQDELLETIYQVLGRDEGRGMRHEERSVSLHPSSLMPHPSSLHILVAEDDEFSGRFMEQLLARAGHRAHLTTSGNEALSLAQQGIFDVLLLDIHMPELDGFAVVGAIREREQATGKHLPVIALTARSRKEDRERCLAAGMDDFLTKPVAPALLLAAIDQLVSKDKAPPPDQVSAPGRKSLLDLAAVLAVCGDDAEGLRRVSQDFQTYAPARLVEVREAMRDRDALRLRQAAHKFCGLLFAFSTVAGNVASELEDRAAQGQLEVAQALVEKLEAMTQELMPLVAGLSLETLRAQAKSADASRADGQR
jgi:PAS domain S-box-containing protein